MRTDCSPTASHQMTVSRKKSISPQMRLSSNEDVLFPPVLLLLSQTLSQEMFTSEIPENWENLPRETLGTCPVSHIVPWQIATDYCRKASIKHTQKSH